MSQSLSLGAASLVAALAGVLWLSAVAPATSQPAPRRPRVAVFFEAGFPAVDVEPQDERALRESLAGTDATFLDAGQLAAALTVERFDTLVMPFGSAFPEAAWSAILEFLRRGGSWVQVGGTPFARPVARGENGWQPSPETTACYKVLGFTHVFEVSASGVASWTAVDGTGVPASLASGFSSSFVYEADIRLTSAKDFPDEDGSDGPREGRVQPLVFGRDWAGVPIAAPLVRIDCLAGAFAGGAWLIAPVKGRVDPRAVRWMVDQASAGAIELTARPTFAGFLPGEKAVVEIAVVRHRPAGVAPLSPSGSPWWDLRAGPSSREQ